MIAQYLIFQLLLSLFSAPKFFNYFNSQPNEPSSIPSDGLSEPTTTESSWISTDAVSETESTVVDEVTSTQIPDVDPSDVPDVDPSDTPDVDPSETPDVDPSETPDVDPSETPVVDPRETPDVDPSETPNVGPSEIPDVDPSEIPDANPYRVPDIDPNEMTDANPYRVPDIDPNEMTDTNPYRVPDVDSNEMTDANPYRIPDVDPSEMVELDPYRIPDIDPNETPEIDPSQVFEVDRSFDITSAEFFVPNLSKSKHKDHSDSEETTHHSSNTGHHSRHQDPSSEETTHHSPNTGHHSRHQDPSSEETTHHSPNTGHHSRHQDPSLLDVCLTIKTIWGNGKPSSYYFQLLCDIAISKKLGELRKKYPQIIDNDDITRSHSPTSRSIYNTYEFFKKESQYQFGPSHTNNYGEIVWDPQISTFQNLAIGKDGKVVFSGSGGNYFKKPKKNKPSGDKAVKRKVKVQFGPSHTNNGEIVWDPQISNFQNIAIGKDGKVVFSGSDGNDLKKPKSNKQSGDEGIQGRAKVQFGPSHTNNGEIDWNPQITTFKNLAIGKDGKVVFSGSDGNDLKKPKSNKPSGDEGIKGRGMVQFGPSHTNNGKIDWNPQITTFKNLAIGKDGKVVFSGSDGNDLKKPKSNKPSGDEAVKGRSMFHFGGSHSNIGGQSWNPQLSSVQNLKLTQSGKEVNVDANKRNKGSKATEDASKINTSSAIKDSPNHTGVEAEDPAHIASPLRR